MQCLKALADLHEEMKNNFASQSGSVPSKPQVKVLCTLKVLHDIKGRRCIFVELQHSCRIDRNKVGVRTADESLNLSLKNSVNIRKPYHSTVVTKNLHNAVNREAK